MPEYRVLQQFLGRKTHGNPVTLAAGSLRVGKNWETTRDNVYRKTRGREAYGSGLDKVTIDQFLEFKKSLIVHQTNETLWYDSDGAGTFYRYDDVDGGHDFASPDSNYLIQGLEANGNLYITTANGIQKLETLTSDVRNAGVPKALGFDTELKTGTWLANNKAVAYRVVWNYTDANGNLVVGAPSERATVVNTSGSAVSVLLRILIPDEITADYSYEVYRSSIVDSTVTPPEDLQLVYSDNPDTDDITNGYVKFTDVLPEGFRGKDLYTNPTQQGIENENTRPPLAKTITQYKEFTFYGNIQNYQRLFTALISVTGLTATTSTITFANGTDSLVLTAIAPIAAATAASAADNGGVVEITTGAAHGMVAGDWIRPSGLTGVDLPDVLNDNIYEIQSVPTGTTMTLDVAWAGSYTLTGGSINQYENIGVDPAFIISGNPSTALQIEETAQSIIRTLNQASGNTGWYGYYVSGVDDIPGQMQFDGRTLAEEEFYLTADSTATGGNFTPPIPTSGTDYKSSNDEFENAVMWSKADQPESVPLINIARVASAADEIFKIVGLRDSLFIIKDQDGVHRLTGETVSSFNIDEFDGTVICDQKNTVAKGQNSIFMHSSLGYVKISDVGVEVVGRDNEFKDLKPVFASGFPNSGYGWFYETEKSYMVATYNLSTSTANDITNVFNTFTNSWMQRLNGVYDNDTNVTCGIVIRDKNYFAPTTGSQILIERKDFLVSDFATPSVDNTITAIDTDTNYITFGTNVTIPDNSTIIQGLIEVRTEAIVSTAQVEVVNSLNLATNVSINISGCADNGSGLIRVTTAAAHGLSTNNSVDIVGVSGTTEANDSWYITVIDATNFDLINSAFINAYTSGGIVSNPITIRPGVESELTYQQVHCGLPEYEKRYKEAHIYFDDDETNVKNLDIITSTDIAPDIVVTPMFESGTSKWGTKWGPVWGSPSETKKVRAYLPEEHSTGSYLNLSIKHNIPQEQCVLCGFSIIYEVKDSRYKT